MQLFHSVKENFIQWTVDSSTYNLEFEDVSKTKELMSTVNSLLPTSATIQTNSPTDWSISKHVVATEEKKIGHSMRSALAIKGFSYSVDTCTAQTKKNTTSLSTVQHSIVLEDKTTHTNIPDIDNESIDNEGVDNESAHSEHNVITDDLTDTNYAQQESSKNNVPPGNEMTNTSKLQCSEMDNESIAPIGSVQSNHAVNLPTRLDLSSCSQEVWIFTFVMCT